MGGGRGKWGGNGREGYVKANQVYLVQKRTVVSALIALEIKAMILTQDKRSKSVNM